jgi:glycosyltransferase 2 family protein
MTRISTWWRSIWVRYSITAVLLVAIVWKIDPRKLADTGHNLNPVNFLFAMSLTVPFLILKALRWLAILRGGKCKATFTESLVSLVGGMGLALLTPARLGELARAAYLSEPRKVRVGALVMVDKVYDVIVLSLLAVPGAWILVSPLLALAFAALGLGGVYLALRPRGLQTAFRLCKPLPFYKKVDGVMGQFAEFPGSVGFTCLIYTVGSFVLVIAQYWIILRAWNVGGLDVVVYCFPMVVLTNAVPITVGGLGPREGLAIVLLNHYGIAGTIAGTSAFLMFFMNTALPGVIGALVTPFFRPPTAAPNGATTQAKSNEGVAPV